MSPITSTSPLTHFAANQPEDLPMAIQLEAIAYAYPGQVPILNQVSFQIKAGERVGFIGHNGCGKTTLFQLICGVLGPTAGEVRIFDQWVQPGAFCSEVGFLFQVPEDQLFSPTVWDDIAFGPYNLDLTDEAVEARVERALELTGTQALASRPPHHLSGGEKQMVAIAGLLAMKPQILLYDEPTASLDLRTRRRLIHFLTRSRETLAIASHDLEFLLEVCDRVILIDQGQVIADGNIRQIMADQVLMEQHGLEKPHSLSAHSGHHHFD
jgi:cobalt/nickel transport system ATP-binding protein